MYIWLCFVLYACTIGQPEHTLKALGEMGNQGGKGRGGEGRKEGRGRERGRRRGRENGANMGGKEEGQCTPVAAGAGGDASRRPAWRRRGGAGAS